MNEISFDILEEVALMLNVDVQLQLTFHNSLLHQQYIHTANFSLQMYDLDHLKVILGRRIHSLGSSTTSDWVTVASAIPVQSELVTDL